MRLACEFIGIRSGAACEGVPSASAGLGNAETGCTVAERSFGSFTTAASCHPSSSCTLLESQKLTRRSPSLRRPCCTPHSAFFAALSPADSLNDTFKWSGAGLAITALVAKGLHSQGFAVRMMSANPWVVMGVGLAASIG